MLKEGTTEVLDKTVILNAGAKDFTRYQEVTKKTKKTLVQTRKLPKVKWKRKNLVHTTTFQTLCTKQTKATYQTIKQELYYGGLATSGQKLLNETVTTQCLQSPP